MGRKVGVTANSHKVIGNLLDSVAERAAERGVTVRIGQKTDMSGDCTSDAAEAFDSAGSLLEAMDAGELDVVGGTAWVWSRPDFAERLDVLVVDEAGQFSLANAVAVSPAARSLVLLGDPQQLDQPLQGTHPPGAEASALGHVLGRRIHHARRPRPLPGTYPSAPSGSVPLHVGGLLRRPAQLRGRPGEPGSGGAGRAFGHGRALCGGAARRQQQRVA